MLLAKVSVGRLEPTLFPLQRLGATSARGVRGGACIGLFVMGRLLRFGWLGELDGPVTLGAELERALLEPRGRRFELCKIHIGVLGRPPKSLGADKTRFFT